MSPARASRAVADLRRATGRAVLEIRRRKSGGLVVDFVTADHVHGYASPGKFMLETVRPLHWDSCGPRFHRSIPPGRWRVKTFMDPHLLSDLEAFRHAREVLSEEARNGGWEPFGGLHAHWDALLDKPVVVLEMRVRDRRGRDRPGG